MKKSFSILLLSLCFPVVALASSPYKFTSLTDHDSVLGQVLLRITIEDAQPKAGICPYFAKSIQYLEGAKLLNVEIYQEVCANDAFGTSKGTLDWFVPGALLTQGAQLHLFVNQKDSGTLVYDEASKSFHWKK
jgi:hypothetical protein